MRKKLFIILGVFISFILALLVAAYFATPILQEKLKTALIAEFSEQSDQQYSIDFDNFSVSLLRGKIYVDSIQVTPKTDSLEIKHIEASSFVIDGIKWRTLLDQRFPKFRSVTINDPVAELYTRRISSAKKASNTSSSLSSSTQISRFDVFIKNGMGKIVQRNGKTVFSLESFDLNTKDVDLNTILQGAYIPYLEDLFFSGSGLYWNLEENLYQFTIENFAFDKTNKMAKIEGLAFTPVLPKYKFSMIKAKQVDRFDLTVSDIEIMGLDMDSLFVTKINLSMIKINEANLEVFHDKHQSPGYGIRYKPLLNAVTKEIGFSLGIEQVEITNSLIRYGEHLPESENPGYISFNNLNGSISNFYSSDHENYGVDSLNLSVSAKFMDTSTLTVDMNYALWDEEDTHSLRASLAALDGKKLNPMLVNTAFTEVEDGFIHGMEVTMKLNSVKATGSMKLEYENLKVKFLDQNDASNTNFKTRLRSLVANTFVVNSENMGNELRIGAIDFDRPKDKAIFGYWWKSIQTGLEDSIK